ncbi:MAG: M48 family metallopeptidase [Rhodanobacter sp.]|nr:M48 family metallopeptidase [Rhodanobacter sp.]
MNRFSGTYYDGHGSRAHAVELECADETTLAVTSEDIDRRIALATLSLSPRLGRTPRTIAFPDGAHISLADDPALDALFPQRSRMHALADVLERRWPAALAAAAIVMTAVVALFVWGMPWVAARVADRLPPSVEKSIGKQTLTLLDGYGFKPSELPPERRAALTQRFDAFVQDRCGAIICRVEFRKADAIGPNAFTLPGGTIIVTDALVGLLGDDDEFLAVIAHELGHQAHHHVMRNVLQSSGVVIIAALFTGDVSSASTVVVTIPAFLLQNHYSRDFESEADDYAFAALAANGISPGVFADVMHKLQKTNPDPHGSMAYLSSHPPSDERIAHAQAAAAAFHESQH